MPKKTIIIAGLLFLLVIGVGAAIYFLMPAPEADNNNTNPEENKPEETDNTIVDTVSQTEVVEANNKFAIDLYEQYQSEEGNLFFSPFSISSAIAMTYEGAKGNTAAEMKQVFYFPTSENLRGGYQSLYQEINQTDKEYQLSTANALWAQEDFQFLDKYFDDVEKYYNGKVENLDFVGESEKSRATINNWVEDQTNDKIKDLIPKGTLDGFTRLVLTNAVYFKGDWVKEFNEDDTDSMPFYNTDDILNAPQVEMMVRDDDESEFNYAENSDLQILEMPYSGEEVSMLVLLPKENDGLADLEKDLTAKNLENWQADLENQRVNVLFPKFKFATKYFMVEDLKEMGMIDAFSSEADFSGMTDKKDLFIGEVIHQAFVEVNEEGTEAAAATAVEMKLSSAEPSEPEIPVFKADHPFIYLIQQKDSGNILFIGRVQNPSA